MKPTEQIEILFPSNPAARDFSHWYWRNYGRAVSDLTNERVIVLARSREEEKETLAKAKEMDGQRVNYPPGGDRQGPR